MSDTANTAYHQFHFPNAEESHMHRHFMPQVLAMCGELKPGTRVLDVGCGNGFTAGVFHQLGCDVTGIDLSETGIATARETHPGVRFEMVAADQHLLEKLEAPPFDIVVSTEVVEHLYEPREWAKGCFLALRPGGKLICTTPFHGYWKNLLISLLNKWDTHANPLWDGGHIKLWSHRTLTTLLNEPGFVEVRFRGAGRVPGLWMTMVASATRPEPASL